MRTRSASMRSRLVCGFLRSVAMNDARRNTRRSSRIREWERDGEGDTSSFGLIVPDSIHIAFHFMMNSLFYIPLSKRHFPHQSSFAHSHFFFLQMSVANWSLFSEESGDEIVLQLMESIVSRCNEGVFGEFSLLMHHITRLEKYDDGRGSIHLLSDKGD